MTMKATWDHPVDAVWEALPGGPVAECQCCGEVWQYMGTVDGRHEFRHRHHPATGKREYTVRG